MNTSTFPDRVQGWLDTIIAWGAEGGLVPAWLVIGAALIGLAACAGPWWPLTRIGITLFHELGHALAGLSIGGRVKNIRLEADTSGVTHWQFAGDPGRLRTAWVAGAGYTFPTLLGSLGAFLCFEGEGRLWAAALSVITAITLIVWVRNLWGFLITFLIAGVSIALTWFNADAGFLVAVFSSVFLLAGSVRASWEHWKERRSHGSDSEVVASNILIPRRLIQGYFLIFSVAVPLGVVFWELERRSIINLIN